MAASYRSTDLFPSTTNKPRSLQALNMLERDMVEKLTNDQSVLKDHDTTSVRLFMGIRFLRVLAVLTQSHSILEGKHCHMLMKNLYQLFISSSPCLSCDLGYENAADTPRSYLSHNDILSFEQVSPDMYNERFYHGSLPLDFQRSFNSTISQSSQQHYGDPYADDFFPFDSSNQQYLSPENIHVSPEFHMFQANSRHFDRYANERNNSETDYMMRSMGNYGLKNNILGEPRGQNLNRFSGDKMFLPMASTRTSMKHLGSSELSANDFDMGSPHDALESAASLSYREQAYNLCKRGSFSASSSCPNWKNDYNLPPFDEAINGSYSDLCHYPAMLDMYTERNRGPRSSRLNGKSKMITHDCIDRFCQQDLLSQFRDAKFFVIKSYSEDNVYKSIKYCVWASTKNGNKKLDAASREAKKKEVACPVFLLFSTACLLIHETALPGLCLCRLTVTTAIHLKVNASAQFCGVAEMVGPVDFNTSVEYWQQDRWSGHFPVKWLIVKDVPNSLFRHIILENNDTKPVTNSRDTQEVNFSLSSWAVRCVLLDDFSFYEERQRAIQDREARQHVVLEILSASATSVPTHPTSSLHDDFVKAILGKVEMNETAIKATARATTARPSFAEADPAFSSDVAGVAGDFPAGAPTVGEVALLVNTAASGELGDIPRSSVHILT
ncbi:unnamed protein product [Arabis nemorensis]|uniref:YTH domain-containing family protein n=1 Tax=Arabis nemorensis TaxID=586526 RepID=A0A565AWA4_9BRAS|nr:unnamed protein product [Arabis nemorensis]